MHRYNSFLIGLNILKEIKEILMEQIKNHQDYQLELKQIVEFPRCRIYRDFIRSLVTNKGIRTNGGSFLFYYIVLCSLQITGHPTAVQKLWLILSGLGNGSVLWQICVLGFGAGSSIRQSQFWSTCRSRTTSHILFWRIRKSWNLRLQTGRRITPYWNTISLARRMTAFYFPDC